MFAVVFRSGRGRILARSAFLIFPSVFPYLFSCGTVTFGQSLVSETVELIVNVRDQEFGGAIERVHVELLRFPDKFVAEQFTDSTGRVAFNGLGLGAYLIRASRDGYQTGEARADFRRGEVSQIAEIALPPKREENARASSGTISRELLRIPDSARDAFIRGLQLLNESKDPRESLKAFAHAIELYPNYADAWTMIGLAEIQLHELDKSEAALRKSLVIAPNSAQPVYLLATVLYSQKKFVEEEALLLDAQKREAAEWKWPFELARCSTALDKWQVALQFAQQAARLPNVPARVHLLLADIQSNLNEPGEAVAELELFSRLDPQSPFMKRVNEVLPTLRQRASAVHPQISPAEY